MSNYSSMCWPSVLRVMMRYCVAPATPVQPSLTVLPRDSTTLRLDTFPTGCSSKKSQRKFYRMLNLQPESRNPTIWIQLPLEAVETGVATSRPSYRVNRVRMYSVLGWRPASSYVVVLCGKETVWTRPPGNRMTSQELPFTFCIMTPQ